MLDQLKLMNLLNMINQGNTQVDPSKFGTTLNNSGDVVNPDNSDDDTLSQIVKLLSPSDDRFNRFADVANKMPNRADYQPSKMRQLAAGLAGIGTARPAGMWGGVPVGYVSGGAERDRVREGLLNDPYNKALADWKNQIDPLKDVAQLERSDNTNKRLIGSTMLTNERGQRKQDETTRASLVREADRERNTDIRRDRADAYIKSKTFADAHPEFKAVTDENGEVVLYNPKDPSTKPISTGIKTGDLSDTEKYDLKISEIKTRADIAKELENIKQSGRTDLEGTRQANRKELEGVQQEGREALKSIETGTSNSATQEKQRLINKANQLISENPELERYFEFTDTGVKIGAGGFRGTEAGRSTAQEALFGKRELIKPEETKTEPNRGLVKPGSVSSQGLLEPGNVDLFKQPEVKNPDGTISTVDSRSFNIDGKEYLLPSVTPDGRHLKSNDAIVDEFMRTGRHLGAFDTPENATKYAEQLHDDYASGKYKSSGSESTKSPNSGTELTPERITAAKSKVEAGNILITDGKKFAQISAKDVGRLKAPWTVVK